MAKGYWIARVDVTDPRGLQAPTRRPMRAAFRNSAHASWSAAASTRSRKAPRARANVVIEFPNYEAALACYRSPEYAAGHRQLRKALRSLDLVIVEGYDGPQP